MIDEQSVETTSQAYLTFMLDKEQFCVAVSSVAKILEMTELTKVPESPAYMKGIINLRGQILPVIDTRIKLGLDPVEPTNKTRILVLEVEKEEKSLTIGAIVDLAKEVIAISNDEILPPPSVDDYKRAVYIDGIVNQHEKFTMIVNINKLFGERELNELETTKE